MENIDISEFDKSEVLVALYNASQPQGMGFLHPACRMDLTIEQAKEYLDRTTYFDYLQGRVMKVDLSGDTLNPRLYDRDNGEGAAERAIRSIKKNPLKVKLIDAARFK